MDEALLKKIDVLFRNVAKATIAGNYSQNIPNFGVRTSDFSITADVFNNSAEWKLANRHAVMLVKLYSQLDKKQQKQFVNLLLDRTFKDSDPDVRIVGAVTLMNTGNQKVLINKLIRNFKDYNDTRLIEVMKAVSETLSYQNNLLNSEIIDSIAEWTAGYVDATSEIGRTAYELSNLYADFTAQMNAIYDKSNEILLNDFELQIEAGYNPDISIDEQKVKEAIHQLGLPIDLTEGLEHISNLVNKADTPSKYRDAMASIRAFNERLLERIAQDLDPDTQIDGKDSRKAVKEFKEKRLISHDVGELITSFRHFLSNDGTHRLKSSQEDARIAKSINIELSLYLLRRLGETR